MGRASVKEDKTVYQIKREELGLTRERAVRLLETISESRIECIELKGMAPHPDEVLVMAEKYKDVSLCNYYCANQCPIGRKYTPEIEIKNLPTVVLQTVASLNALDKQKDRLIEIAQDSQIGDDELSDFQEIQQLLKKASMAIESLRLWADQMDVEQQ